MADEAETPHVSDDSDEGEELSSVDDFLREVAFMPRLDPPGEPQSRIGETIGRFQLTGLLGRGGMGVVYAAFDVALHREVALKLLPADAVESEDRRRRLLREARSAAAVSHPNIAAVFDVGEIDGAVFIAMERVHGRSLRAALEAAAGAIAPAEAARIGREIARGLAAAHEAGVIHRDIKPENVMIGGNGEVKRDTRPENGMIGGNGEVKLLDFGLAKLLGAEGSVGASATSHVTTREGRILGTPSYMSPEQARGLPADPRSDVFAFGVVLFEMLAGERPFRGATATDVLAAIVRDAPPRLASRGAGISGALASVVARCLEKDPSARYTHAGELLAALDAAERAPESSPLRRRWPWVAVPVAAVTLALALPTARSREGAAGATGATEPIASAPTTAPAPRPTAVTDLPLPPSSSADAIAAYRIAMHSFRDASWGQAELSLRLALKHDPTLAAAHLRLALIMSNLTYTTPEARASYREAARLRSTLTPRDRALLAALEPSLSADPVDVVETARRLDAMTEHYPLDAEVFNLLAAYRRLDAPERRLQAVRRAVEIDPDYADAWQQIGASLVDTDPDGAIAALERCTSIAPTATDCWGERANVESVLGRCAEAEAHIRRATGDPRASEHYFQVRAHLLHALGKPREAVAEVFRQRWARLDAGSAQEEETYDGALLAAAYGDFGAARAQAAEGLRRADAQPTLSAHARFALLLADIEIEAGRAGAAAAVARDFLERRDAWQLGLPTDDPTVVLARIAARGGALAQRDVRARRDVWYRAARPVTAIQKAQTWGLAYVHGIERGEDAVEALSARPADAGWTLLDGSLDAALGRALWLGGKKHEALPHLARTFARCDGLPSIFTATRSSLLFGRALEERGDRGRACDVYRTILARWGGATPRSVTAEAANARSLALRCDAAPG